MKMLNFKILIITCITMCYSLVAQVNIDSLKVNGVKSIVGFFNNKTYAFSSQVSIYKNKKKVGGYQVEHLKRDTDFYSKNINGISLVTKRCKLLVSDLDKKMYYTSVEPSRKTEKEKEKLVKSLMEYFPTDEALQQQQDISVEQLGNKYVISVKKSSDNMIIEYHIDSLGALKEMAILFDNPLYDVLRMKITRWSQKLTKQEEKFLELSTYIQNDLSRVSNTFNEYELIKINKK